MPLDPTTAAVLAEMARSDAPPMHTLPPDAARAGYAQMQGPAPEVAVGSVEERAVPGPQGDIPVRIYRPRGDGPHPVHVFYHGGGWVIGNLDTHDFDCREICNGAIVHHWHGCFD